MTYCGPKVGLIGAQNRQNLRVFPPIRIVQQQSYNTANHLTFTGAVGL